MKTKRDNFDLRCELENVLCPCVWVCVCLCLFVCFSVFYVAIGHYFMLSIVGYVGVVVIFLFVWIFAIVDTGYRWVWCMCVSVCVGLREGFGEVESIV